MATPHSPYQTLGIYNQYLRFPYFSESLKISQDQLFSKVALLFQTRVMEKAVHS